MQQDLNVHLDSKEPGAGSAFRADEATKTGGTSAALQTTNTSRCYAYGLAYNRGAEHHAVGLTVYH